MASKSKWRVEYFADYHEIYSDTYKTIELGCFPVMDCGCGCYFGLFYKGRKPSVKKVLQSVFKKVTFEKILHYRTLDDISCTKEEVEQEVKESMKNRGREPAA